MDCLKKLRKFSLSFSPNWLNFQMKIFSFARAGRSSFRQQAACFSIRGIISFLVASICSMAVIPSIDFSSDPALIFFMSLGIRVIKNSSRLLPQMAMNFTLSSRGCHRSCASSRTRLLNLIQLSSLLMK